MNWSLYREELKDLKHHEGKLVKGLYFLRVPGGFRYFENHEGIGGTFVKLKDITGNE